MSEGKKIEHMQSGGTNNLNSQEHGFDKRIVRYEEIHKITDDDYDTFIRTINIKPGIKLLDCGCGYGAITREIFKRYDISFPVTLFDISCVQLSRAEEELSTFPQKKKFIKGDIVNAPFEDEYFDRVVAAMVIHEIPKELQLVALKEINRILVKGGKLIIMDLFLTAETQQFFRDVIRKKDILAGYHQLAERRYFLQENEWRTLLKDAGFKDFQVNHHMHYKLVTSARLRPEFGGDLTKLRTWESYIRECSRTLSDITLSRLNFQDDGDSISFVPRKAIFSVEK